MTKTELIKQLGTSRGTLYRHMAKLGIDKGKELSNDDVKRITISITGNTKVSQDNTIQKTEQRDVHQENQALRENLKIQDSKIKQLEDKIDQLEQDNRNLLQQLSNSLAMHNEVNKQYSNFMIEMKSLMAPPVEEKNERPPLEDKSSDDVKNEEEVKKKKKWWQL